MTHGRPCIHSWTPFFMGRMLSITCIVQRVSVMAGQCLGFCFFLISTMFFTLTPQRPTAAKEKTSDTFTDPLAQNLSMGYCRIERLKSKDEGRRGHAGWSGALRNAWLDRRILWQCPWDVETFSATIYQDILLVYFNCHCWYGLETESYYGLKFVIFLPWHYEWYNSAMHCHRSSNWIFTWTQITKRPKRETIIQRVWSGTQGPTLGGRL